MEGLVVVSPEPLFPEPLFPEPSFPEPPLPEPPLSESSFFERSTIIVFESAFDCNQGWCGV